MHALTGTNGWGRKRCWSWITSTWKGKYHGSQWDEKW